MVPPACRALSLAPARRSMGSASLPVVHDRPGRQLAPGEFPVPEPLTAPCPSGEQGEAAPSAGGRPAVDGKFLRVGGRRFLIRGVTYGTFVPNRAGELYP